MNTTVTRGIVRGYDAATHTATIELAGASGTLLNDVPVALDVDGAHLTEGAKVILVWFDSTNPTDGCIVAVYE